MTKEVVPTAHQLTKTATYPPKTSPTTSSNQPTQPNQPNHHHPENLKFMTKTSRSLSKPLAPLIPRGNKPEFKTASSTPCKFIKHSTEFLAHHHEKYPGYITRNTHKPHEINSDNKPNTKTNIIHHQPALKQRKDRNHKKHQTTIKRTLNKSKNTSRSCLRR